MIVVPRYYDGVKWTKRGENVEVIQQKFAICHKAIELELFTCDTPLLSQLKSAADLDHQRSERRDQCIIAEPAVWKDVIAFVDDRSNLKFITDIQVQLGNGKWLTNASERDVANVIEWYIGSRKNGIVRKTFKAFCCRLRKVFRVFGREHALADGIDLSHGNITFSSGNPVTEAVVKRYEGEVMKNRGKSKYSLPVSLPLLYFTNVMQLEDAVDKYRSFKRTSNDDKNIVNLCTLTLLKSFIMHEGARPSENLDNLKHKDLKLVLHDEVPWLTLVFLRHKTLAKLMESDRMHHYFVGFWKAGKGGKNLRQKGRVKSVVPAAYNTLDVLWWYVVCTKLMLRVTPGLLNDRVFPKRNKNVSAMHKDNNKHVAFTFYGMRYAAAEEDVALTIPSAWTKYRMGQSMASRVFEDYAKNWNMRPVTEDEVELPLGTDKVVGNKSPLHPDLEMNLVTGCQLREATWLKDTLQDDGLVADFIATNTMVTEFLESPRDQDKRDALIKKLTLRFDKIPFGANIKIADNMLPPWMLERLERAMAGLAGKFKPVDPPKDRGALVLRYYAQVLYNHWGNPYSKVGKVEPVPDMPILDSDSESDEEEDKGTKKRAPAKKPEAVVEEDEFEDDKPKKRARRSPAKKAEPEPATEKEDEDESVIRKGSIVALLAPESKKKADAKYLFRIPADIKLPPVWFMYAVTDSRSVKKDGELVQELKGSWFFSESKSKLVNEDGSINASKLDIDMEAVEPADVRGVNVLYVFKPGTPFELGTPVMAAIKESLYNILRGL